MILASSVWIDHLRGEDNGLSALLNDGRIMTHPFVIGELALGNLNDRTGILSSLQNLPAVPVGTDREVLFFIERQQLAGREIGYVDAHLLAATAPNPPVHLWTQDRKLRAVATSLEPVRVHKDD